MAIEVSQNAFARLSAVSAPAVFKARKRGYVRATSGGMIDVADPLNQQWRARRLVRKARAMVEAGNVTDGWAVLSARVDGEPVPLVAFPPVYVHDEEGVLLSDYESVDMEADPPSATIDGESYPVTLSYDRESPPPWLET